MEVESGKPTKNESHGSLQAIKESMKALEWRKLGYWKQKIHENKIIVE